MASARAHAQRARDLRTGKPELIYDPVAQCWNEKVETRRNFAAERKAKNQAEAEAAAMIEKHIREEAAAVQRRREWAERSDAEARERSGARAEEIREWRTRQRGELLHDPKFDTQHDVSVVHGLRAQGSIGVLPSADGRRVRAHEKNWQTVEKLGSYQLCGAVETQVTGAPVMSAAQRGLSVTGLKESSMERAL